MPNIMTPTVNPNTTSTQTNTAVAPDWYNNFQSGLPTAIRNATSQGGVAPASGLQTVAYNAAPTAINAGLPSLNQATIAATGVATTPTSSLIDQYMNPYTQSVVKSIGDLGRQQFQEFTAPSVNAAGVATGQFGGSRAQDINAKAARDAAMNITAQQAQAMNTGWQNSVAAAQNQQNLGLNSANVLGNLSSQAQNQATSGLNTLSTLGAQQQTTAQAEKNYPMTALEKEANIIAGQNVPTGSKQTITGPAGSGQLTDSLFTQLSKGGSGLGSLLQTPVDNILGNGNKDSVLSWLQKTLLQGAGNTGEIPPGWTASSDGTYTDPVTGAIYNPWTGKSFNDWNAEQQETAGSDDAVDDDTSIVSNDPTDPV